MADIELVIKIPEEIMEYVKNNGCLSVIYNDEVADAIANGTPIPKGCRLIDANAYLAKERPRGIYEDIWKESHIYKSITEAPTIIETDKEEN